MVYSTDVQVAKSGFDHGREDAASSLQDGCIRGGRCSIWVSDAACSATRNDSRSLSAMTVAPGPTARGHRRIPRPTTSSGGPRVGARICQTDCSSVACIIIGFTAKAGASGLQTTSSGSSHPQQSTSTENPGAAGASPHQPYPVSTGGPCLASSNRQSIVAVAVIGPVEISGRRSTGSTTGRVTTTRRVTTTGKPSPRAPRWIACLARQAVHKPGARHNACARDNAESCD